jgi:hypothetical protein
MIKEASSKIESEMLGKKDNPCIQVVGGFLLKHLDSNPQDAEKILKKDKDIAKSLDEMRKAAEKKKVGNVAVLTDEEGFKIVLEYFGIGATEEEIPDFDFLM